MPAVNDAFLRKAVLRVALGTALLLLVPALAMQFTDEVSWGPGDFLLAAVLIFGAGTGTVVARRRIARRGTRIAVVAAMVLGFALVWAELAVGLFH
jgi:hypothetical protein